MKRLISLITVIFGCEIIMAQMTLNSNLSIYFEFPNIDSSGNILNDSMEVRQFNIENGENQILGVVDVSQYGLPYFNCIDYVKDWIHQRVLFSPGYQGSSPIWYILDLKTLEISRPLADSLNRFTGALFISPNGKYLIGFHENTNSMKTRWQDSLIFTTYVFNTDDYSLVKRLPGMTAFQNIIPPDFFWGNGDSVVFIRNPYQYADNRDLLKFSFPDMKMISTISMKQYCKSRREAVEDMCGELALVYYSCDDNGTIQVSYKYIDLNSGNLLSEMILPETTAYQSARISPDGELFLFQTDTNSVIAYDNKFNYRWSIGDIKNWVLPYAIFKNGNLFIRASYHEKINKIDIGSGNIIEQIVTHKAAK